MAKLTTKAVEAIKPTTARKEIPDALLPGLYLIVQPSGARSWAVRYRHNGKPRKHTLGPFPAIDLKAARTLGAKALRAVAEGTDPAIEKQALRAQRDSVEDVVARFAERHLRRNYRPTPLAEAERLLRLNVIATWRGRVIGDITRRDVREMLDRIMDNGTPVAANRIHSITRKLFSWAVENEIIPASPVAGLKPPAVERSRDRVLTAQELRAVWNAAGRVDPIYGALVRLLVLTGQRRGEIAGLMWSEIDLERKLISLPRERVKNDRAHEVRLSPQAMAVIKGLPRISETHVFSMTGNGPINGFGKPKRRLDELCGFSDWVLHDIRRSVATGMAEIGTQPYVVEAVLNHVSGHKAGVAGIYNRSQYAGEKRAALKAWADHISSVIASKPAPRTGNGGVYYGEYSGVRGAVLSRSTKAAARR